MMLPSPPETRSDRASWTDVTLTMDELMPVVSRITLVAAVAVFVPYVLLWGLPDLPGLEWAELAAWVVGAAVVSLLVYAASAVLHEGLHAAAMVLFAGLSWRNLHFGVRLHEGVAYVHADRPMTVRAYRAVLVLPLLLQGVVPALVGMLAGNGWVVLYGYVMIASAAGDIAVLRLLRGYEGGRLVRDHPHDIGCQVR